MPTQVISFHYKLTDPNGVLLDASAENEPLAFLAGSGQIIPGLEKVLLTLKAGEQKCVEVAAGEAYGPRDERLVITVPRQKFPVPNVQIGDQFQSGDGGHQFPLTAVEVSEESVVLDGNHPLAGVDLSFDVTVVQVREATEEELAHGHAHGAHGHHH